MMGDNGADYLTGLPEDQRATLARANAPGLTKLREYLGKGDAVAFLGAGVSAPMYPLWTALIAQLVEAAAYRLTERQAATARALAVSSPEEVVEILRRSLGVAAYRDVLRQVLGAKTDEVTGRTWTPVQELVCRCAFKAVVTTNYDPGIVDARIRVRTWLPATGFTIWDDELGLDGWRDGRIFGDVELPVLYAHGYFNRPDSVVLATTEYRRAYEGKLAKVLASLVDREHLAWIGFSFADQRIGAILREVAMGSGTRMEPGKAPQHVVIMPWDPGAEGNDPEILSQRAEISYGARLVLYPAIGDDHSALRLLLADLTDPQFPAAAVLPRRPARAAAPDEKAEASAPAIPARWVPEPERVEHFTGRVEELARLDRWAADPQVSLVGVTAWGGAGKTALVTRWVQGAAAASQLPRVRGVFGWGFYSDPSVDNWAQALLTWAEHEFGVRVEAVQPAAAVLTLLRAVPLLLVLDGLEVAQEGPAGDRFGRLLDGTLREVLAGVCQTHSPGLVLLTSRFPFADLETFDGGSARMLEVPPFTPAEGAALLAAAGGGWLAEDARLSLVRAVDGHALAVGVLAGLLAARPPDSDLDALERELTAAARTDARVGRVLEFYAERLSEADRYLLAAVSLFARPVPAAAVLAVAGHDAFAGHLANWTPVMVEAAVRDRLGGLVSLQDGRVSAHPLVRDTFRPLCMAAAAIAAETTLTGLPEGTVTNSADATVVVEAVELLLDAGEWASARDMYRSRFADGDVWKHLPAARLGQRAASAFVATPARRDACGAELGDDYLAFYLNEVGLFAMLAGDLGTARQFFPMTIRQQRKADNKVSLAGSLNNLAETLGHQGDFGAAMDAVSESLDLAEETGERRGVRNSQVILGWLAGLAGDTAEAVRHFNAADQIELADDPDGDHLYSGRGTQWAEWLIRTGRLGPASALTERNAEICRMNGWNNDLALCNRVLGRLDLAAGDAGAAGERLTAAGERLTAAAETFRGGDYLTELAVTLTDAAEQARVTKDLDAAERCTVEAISITSPRGLVPAQSAALAARARIRADQAAAAEDKAAGPDYLAQGRDAADVALRLATRHELAWHMLDALRAHAALDRAESSDRGWAAKAEALYVRLVPPDLDPDPLATVAERVAADRAAGEAQAGTATETNSDGG